MAKYIIKANYNEEDIYFETRPKNPRRNAEQKIPFCRQENKSRQVYD